MITRVEIQNYRSIVNASIDLAPFTLLIGANGTGKSNFLQLLKEAPELYRTQPRPKHLNHPSTKQQITFTLDHGRTIGIGEGTYYTGNLEGLQNVSVFSVDPANAGRSEELTIQPVVHEDGSGVVQVLDSLKTGDREDLFDLIVSTLEEYVPEIERLSFIPGQATKQLQVREKNIAKPMPVSQLSSGTRLVLTILTILFQERPPSLICIEEIDRELHPRLFGQIVQLCFDMANKDGTPQIIATTHNPYMVDQFKDNEAAVIIVEKKDGETTFTSLEDRLKDLEPEEEPLGELWYSGFLGGVPVSGDSAS